MLTTKWLLSLSTHGQRGSSVLSVTLISDIYWQASEAIGTDTIWGNSIENQGYLFMLGRT